MTSRTTRGPSRADGPLMLVALAVFLICGFYGYMLVFYTPQPGFTFTNAEDGWRVTSLDGCTAIPEWCENRVQLRVDDMLVQIGDLDFTTYHNDWLSMPFEGKSPGDTVLLLGTRAGEDFAVQWEMPEVLIYQRLARLSGTLLFLPFWVAGVVVLLFLQPRDSRWRLLILFNFLTAIWLSVGVVSSWQAAFSSPALHIATWLIMPVYLHLHLIVPSPLFPSAQRRIVIGFYAAALLLGVLELAGILPRQSYLLAFAVAIIGSIALLLYRSLNPTRSGERPATNLMLTGIILAFAPGVLIAFGASFLGSSPGPVTLYLSLLVIPVLPLFYTYAQYKHRLGSLEFRANRLLGVYAYGVLTLAMFVLVFGMGSRLTTGYGSLEVFFFNLFTTILFVTISVAVRPHFQRWVNRLAYGARHDPDEIFVVFAGRIPGITERHALAELLTQEILPSLLIRESALIVESNKGTEQVLYWESAANLGSLSAADPVFFHANRVNRYLPASPATTGPYAWVRLVIPINIRQEQIGLWLFGRRDPDDYYPQYDIQLLGALANQIAPVLENIQLFEVVQRKLDEQTALLAASRAVSASLEWPRLLERVAEVIGQAIDATTVYITDWNEVTGSATVLAEFISTEPQQQHSIVGHSFNLQEEFGDDLELLRQGGVLSFPVPDEPAQPDSRRRLTSLGNHHELVLPLQAKQNLLGLVILWDGRLNRRFTKEEVALGQAIAQQVGLAFDNAQLFQAEARRREEAELLAEISRFLASTLELGEVLQRVVDSVRRYMPDINNCAISILEHDGMALRSYISWHDKEEHDLNSESTLVWLKDSTVYSQAIVGRAPVVIHDLLSAPLEMRLHEMQMIEHLGLRALLYVPLMVRGGPIGMLQVNIFGKAYQFQESEVTFCINVAHQAATAIENARLFEAERRQLHLAQTLRQMGALLTSRLRLSEVYERVFDLLAEVVEFDGVSIQLYDQSGKLRLAASRGSSDSDVVGVISEQLTSAIAGKGNRSQEGLVIPATNDDERWLPQPETVHIQSWMGMPLKVKGVTIGILGVDSKTPYAYNDAVGETVQAFANQAAVAIENARLYKETQERANELAILHQVALATSAVVEADDLLEQTTKMIVRRLSYPSFGFLLVDAEKGELVAHPSFYGLQFGSDQLRVPLASADPDSEIRMGEPRIIRQFSRSDALSGLLNLAPDMQAMISVPVQVQLQVYSVLCVLSPKKDVFGGNDVRFLTTLAGLVAAAIERAQLYNTLQNDAARLSAQVDRQTAQLRQERDRTQAILDNAGEGIFFVSPDGRIQYANPAAMSLTGYVAPESIGLPLWDWFGDALSEEMRTGIREIVSTGRSWSGELTGRRKSGENYDAQVTLATISGGGERLAGFVGVLSDITRLREIDRLRAEIIANLSHELRTPLTNINTYIALLERGRPESRERHLRVLRLEAERLARLIDDLLDFSHQQERVPRFRPVELTQLLEQVVAAFQAQAEEKGVELQLLPAGERLVVSGDSHQLGQVFSNLIDNAIAYTPGGGHVTISTDIVIQGSSEEAAVRIIDSGIGIAQKDLPFIFERFYRGRAAQDNNIPGTGLGLAITQEIVQNHGGIVEVGSTLGAGATFVIRLPMLNEFESPSEELVKTVG